MTVRPEAFVTETDDSKLICDILNGNPTLAFSRGQVHCRKADSLWLGRVEPGLLKSHFSALTTKLNVDTIKRVRRALTAVRLSEITSTIPRGAKAQPWAGIRERFQR